MEEGDARGQITIFIIAGVLIVVAIVIFIIFFTSRGGPRDLGVSDESADAFLHSCIQEPFIQIIENVKNNGGYASPREFSKGFKFSDESSSRNVTYLCYTSADYTTCVNQEPMLISSVEDEIYNELEPVISECFLELGEMYENDNYQVSMKDGSYDLRIDENRVLVEMNREISLERSGEAKRYDYFKVSLGTQLSSLLGVAQEIVNAEVESCNFDAQAYTLLYPEIRIDYYKALDGSNIYRLIDKETREEFFFATRGCVINPIF